MKRSFQRKQRDYSYYSLSYSLSCFCGALSIGFDGTAILLCIFFCVFLFYTINYRRLDIYLYPRTLSLKFGVFHWSVPLENIAEIQLDEVPILKRFGGAGIHFMSIRGRYRASFNFLEHPRIVIKFKEKIGPVRDLSFSTRSPEVLIDLINRAVNAI